MRAVAALAAVLAFGCASTDASDPIIVSPAPAADPRISEIQTQLTELLERMDVMSTRLARLEEGAIAQAVQPAQPSGAAAASAAGAPGPMSQARRPVPAPEASTAQQEPAASSAQPQRALIGAQLAEDYREAIVLFGRGRHADARKAFEAVFASEDAGDLADNALFWIGETYFAVGDFNNAVRYYMRVVNEYGEENKAPDALFKTALAQARTGDLALARRTLQQVIDRYPYSSTASSAKAELQRIRF